MKVVVFSSSPIYFYDKHREELGILWDSCKGSGAIAVLGR